jgi:2-dehydro-3-deoxygluconokinase
MTAAGVALGGRTGPVVTLGETMLLLTGATDGALDDLDAMSVDTGGAESNTAIGLVRAGRPTVWVGRIGDDPAGSRVRRDIAGAGVETIAIVDPALPTGLMLKEHLPDGRTRVSYHRRGSAASALCPEDLPDGLVERAALLHITGITLAISPTARATVFAAIDRAERAGVPVSFDVNHRPKLIDADDARDVYRQVARRSSIVFAGDDEARLLLGLPHDEQTATGAPTDADADLAIALADHMREAALGGGTAHTGTAVVKLGSRGAVAATPAAVFRRAATPVAVVDPVGAGDAFVAAYLATVLDGGDTATALDRGADAGARACTHEGDWREPPPRPTDGSMPHDRRPRAHVTGATHDRVDR